MEMLLTDLKLMIRLMTEPPPAPSGKKIAFMEMLAMDFELWKEIMADP